LRLDFYGLAIEVVGLVSPLTNGLERGLGEDGITAQDLGIDDHAFFVDRGFDLHSALRMNGERGLRIYRFYALDEKPLRDTLRNS
jgi:hypothetical protein